MFEDNNKSKEIVAATPALPEKASIEPVFEEISVFEEAKQNCSKSWVGVLAKYWRFSAIATAFAAIFLSVYIHLSGSFYSDDNVAETLPDGSIQTENVSTDATTEQIQASVSPEKSAIEVLDEAGVGIDIHDYLGQSSAFLRFNDQQGKINVLIIHAHSYEYVSASMSVIEAGDAISQILNSAGIYTLHCKTRHDENGSIGSYDKLSKSVESIKKEHGEIVLIIDLHDSDTNAPYTFTVGTGTDFAWKENLRVAAALSEKIEDFSGVIRLLPDSLAQDNGVLTISIGIGGKDIDDSVARQIISEVVQSIILLCTENTP